MTHERDKERREETRDRGWRTRERKRDGERG